MPSDRIVAAMKARADDWRNYLRSIARDRPETSSAAETIIAAIDRGEPIDIPSVCFEARVDWTRSIKIARAATGMTIEDAAVAFLEHDGWLRLIKRKCQTDPACAKQLRHAARRNAFPDWIELRDGKAVFRR